MGDAYQSRWPRFVGVLIVAVPLVLILGSLIALRTDLVIWGGVPLWKALSGSVLVFVVIPLAAALLGRWMRELRGKGR